MIEKEAKERDSLWHHFESICINTKSQDRVVYKNLAWLETLKNQHLQLVIIDSRAFSGNLALKKYD